MSLIKSLLNRLPVYRQLQALRGALALVDQREGQAGPRAPRRQVTGTALTV